MKRALFICSQNRLRSPTAEQVFASWPEVETDSAGLAPDAVTPLSGDQLEWADIIFVMERHHRTKLARKFKAHLKTKRIVCLDIPDKYDFMAPLLTNLLSAKAGPLLKWQAYVSLIDCAFLAQSFSKALSARACRRHRLFPQKSRFPRDARAVWMLRAPVFRKKGGKTR